MKQLLTLVVIALATSSASAIRCYVCNSHNDTDCMDITPGSKSKFLRDCSDNKDGNTYTLCRKIEMSMDMDFGEVHPAERRIHRACGYIEHDEGRECYYKSGYNTRSWVCSCTTDDCNSAHTLSSYAIGTVLSAGVAILVFIKSFISV